jgi:hypothetical protein
MIHLEMGQDKNVERQNQQGAPRRLNPGEQRQQEREDEHRHVHDPARGEKRTARSGRGMRDLSHLLKGIAPSVSRRIERFSDWVIG